MWHWIHEHPECVLAFIYGFIAGFYLLFVLAVAFIPKEKRQHKKDPEFLPGKDLSDFKVPDLLPRDKDD